MEEKNYSLKVYIDKNNEIIKDEDFIVINEGAEEIVCQALRCDDGTLLYEELKYDYKKGDLSLTDEPNYPDAYSKDEIKIISFNRAVSILRKKFN